MDQLEFIKKKNDLTRFIQLLDEENFSKLENHLITENYEVETTDTLDHSNLMSETIASDSGNELLTEEVKEKLQVIFNSSVNNKVSEQIKGLTDKVDKFLTESQQSVDSYAEYVKQELELVSEQKIDEMEDRLDSYLDYVINEWVEENKIGIETGVKNQISDSVLLGLKKLFESNYIDVPQENINLITELEDKSKSLYESNVDLNAKVKTLSKKVSDLNKRLIIEEESRDLTDIDKERLQTLSETVKVKTTEEFKNQIHLLKESLTVPVSSNSSSRENISQTQLNEGNVSITQEKESGDVDPKIQAYLDAMLKMR